MPIYAYRCESCGFEKDALQKMSDAPLTVCPSCGAATLRKQVTAAGFQLKGSGWYVTDFRGGPKGAAGAASDKDGSGGAAANADKADAGKNAGAAKTEGAEGTKGGEANAKPAASSSGATPASGTGSASAAPASGPSAAS